MTASLPIGLFTELTRRCHLHCSYCSNSVNLDKCSNELTTDDWKRVFSQANVLQLHLSGGEPTARVDLGEIVEHCAKLELYTNLITSGVMLDEAGLNRLSDVGLDYVQLSLQDVDPLNTDDIGVSKVAMRESLHWVIKL